MLTDTHPEAERVQLELLRKKTPAERFALMRSLTAFVTGLSRRSLMQANPDLSEADLRIKIIELQYGKELAQRVRNYLSTS
jgi:head-tail adaptor